ncbi:hypothetical protein D7Z96_11055 [Pseudarthrobacter phenanthrenivorans]|uniref:Uncharacterized protein n=2 Tax=Pseudarthrobacter phenanthrenivorans TaxID=361575 RepID=A0A3B0FKD1_PSEPS|nr:hypothetical protein Asphe3_02680 [Pseudarthrobacter phenanthrenivorans Sphe3]RKO23383.1 hypothetical protein D7Z96_11055 [Pseudarthrobacter phenanthrenivorans]TPV51193.1 hypothetical protein FJ661_09040 [Pseudarthrobacter phenanthrenivorans]
MCYSSSKDFGWGRKEADHKPEAKQDTPVETPERAVKAPDFTFWSFPWKSPAAGSPSAERSKERV